MSRGNARYWMENARAHLNARLALSTSSARLPEMRCPAHSEPTSGSPHRVGTLVKGGRPIARSLRRFTAPLREQQTQLAGLDTMIAANHKELGYGG